jgi:hypothetical protein
VPDGTILDGEIVALEILGALPSVLEGGDFARLHASVPLQCGGSRFLLRRTCKDSRTHIVMEGSPSSLFERGDLSGPRVPLHGRDSVSAGTSACAVRILLEYPAERYFEAGAGTKAI